MLLSIELSRLRIESFFCLFIPFLPYHGKLGRNPCDGSRVVSNILRIPRKIHCCHCDLVVKRGTNSLKKSTVPCPRGLRALAFRIPLNGCGSRTQMRLESSGETFGSRTGDLSPLKAPQFYLVCHALSPGSLRPHEDGSPSLGRRGTHFISERLVTNNSRFSCLSTIVYTCPPKWSTLPVGSLDFWVFP